MEQLSDIREKAKEKRKKLESERTLSDNERKQIDLIDDLLSYDTCFANLPIELGMILLVYLGYSKDDVKEFYPGLPILNFLDDTNMIGQTILRPGFAIGRIPVKEDNHTGHRCGSSICPLPTILEPLNTPYATGELGNNTGINIAALVGTPGHETGTPCHTGVKAIRQLR